MAVIPKSHLSTLQKHLAVIGVDIAPKSHLPFHPPLSLIPTSFPLFQKELMVVGMDIVPKSHLFSCSRSS